MRAGISRSRAACATAAPWLPPEAATTPAAGMLRRSRFAKAPRALKEPDCCSSSSLSTSVRPGRPKSWPSTSTMGVKRMYGRIRVSVAAICSRPTLEGFTEHPAGLGDALLVAAVEGPLLDPLRLDQAQAGKDLEVLVRAGLGDAELVGDEEAAHAVLDRVVFLHQVLLGAQERGRRRVGEPEVGVLCSGEETDGKRDLRMEREQVGGELAPCGADVGALLPGDLQRDRARLRSERDESQLATRVLLRELVSQLRDGQRGRVSGEHLSRRKIQLLVPRVGLALVEVLHGRLAGAEVDLDLPNARLAAALDPAEAVLGELGLEAQPVVLDGDAAILETPHRVHHEPVTLELLGELAVGDELAALIAHRREAVQVGLRIPQRHAPGRQGEEQGAQRQDSGHEV